MKQTAIARYQRLALTGRQPNKRIRKAAWIEANALLRQGEGRDRAAIEQVRADDARWALEMADRLYGADKYGRDTKQNLVIPSYFSQLPSAPEHGFRFVVLEGIGVHLWHGEAWVKLSGELMRRIESHALRVEMSSACQFQERRNWYGQVLRFRDQHMQIEHRRAMEDYIIRV